MSDPTEPMSLNDLCDLMGVPRPTEEQVADVAIEVARQASDRVRALEDGIRELVDDYEVIEAEQLRALLDDTEGE